MSERAAYSRVYWGIVDDPKFASIYDDDRHLACWLRLLLIADQSHPASANIPSGTRRASVLALAEAGLIAIGTGSRFRIVGLDAERERRRIAATRRTPSGDQSGPKRDPDGPYTPGLRRDETRQAEGRRDETTREQPDGREDVEAFVLVKRRAPTEGQRHLLDRVIETHDESGPAWAADIILSNPADPIGAVIEADKAWRSDRIEAAKAVERMPKPQRKPPGLPPAVQELADHLATIDRENARKNGAA